MNNRIEKGNLLKSSIILFFTIILTFIVYKEIGNHQFQTAWDDQWAVQNWYTEEGFSGENTAAILFEFYGGQYAPLNQFYYTFLYNLFGYNAAAFHMAGLVIHILTIVAVFLFLVKFLKCSGLIEQCAIIPVCSATVLLFAIHPFNVESVAWLAASKILLYGLFYFLALYAYLFYRESGRKVLYFSTLLLFSISLFAKEQAAILPFTLLLIDFILSGNKIRKQDLIEKIPFILISIFWGLITMLAQLSDNSGVMSESAQYPFIQRVSFGAYSLSEYFIKCIIPVKLMYLYPFPNVISEPLNNVFYFYPIFVLLFLILFFRYYQVKWLFFGGAFFIINLLMVLHIVPISRFAIVADRYVYVASVGACFLISYIMYKMVVKAKTVFRKRVILVGCFVFVMYLGAYAYMRNLVWHDTETLKKEIKSIIRSRSDYRQLEQQYYDH